MIRRFRHKGLERIFQRGDTSGVNPQLAPKLRRMLILRDKDTDPSALNMPGGSRAVELDARDPLAQSALGVAFMEHGEHDKAIAAHGVATTLNPNSALGQWCFGYALNRAGRCGEALERFDMALRLSPRDPAAWSYLTLRASALYNLGRYGDAAAAAREATRAPVVDLIWPLVHLAASLGRLGQREEAARAIEALRAIRPGLTIGQFRTWPHNRSRSAAASEDVVAGLREAGLPE
jgi:tetratricopeptide (TPR) repeat protein